jgi:putative ABC transport system permease protein
VKTVVKFSTLTKANTKHYRRYYLLIMAATLIMTAVIAGSLMVGEAVRYTLISRVKERIGGTETVIFSKNSFFESALANTPPLGKSARPVLLSNGFIPDAGRLIPVMVWGVDDKDIPADGAKINGTLADELSLKKQQPADLALRLPATGLVPSGSLFVTDSYTTSLRLSFAGIVDAKDGGNLNLKNEQIIPCNIFVNRNELASALKVEGKINLIFSDNIISAAELAEVWSPSLSGISERGTGKFTEITSDRIFLQRDMVEAIEKSNRNVNRLFSYMANSLAAKGDAIPYSFVTAMDEYNGRQLKSNEIVLSDYAAARLRAEKNDTIQLTCFVSGDLKTLSEETVTCCVADIVPIYQLVEDKTLSAEFPGLSDVEKCTDWDSDMPIDMSRVTKEDEDYWAQYRSTPKAIIAYSAIADKWSNAYGSATALRISGTPNMSRLEPSMLGIQIIHPREAGLAAAQNGIDFASLFLALGIFIVFSAVLLMLVPLSEMVFCRRNELALMNALGFPKQRTVKLLWTEALAVVLRASPVGVAAGVCYTALMLLLLNSLWSGAVHTDGFTLFPTARAMLAGWAASTAIALLLLRIAIVRAVGKADKPRPVKPVRIRQGRLFTRTKLIWAGLYANKKRAWLSFATLASGVLIVFSVGLNRRGFADSSQLRSGTGGYSLWCESSVPVYHNIATPEGRRKLALNDLPEDMQVLQLLRYSADDASCLNLNKVTQPTVLGVDMESLKNSDFKVLQSVYEGDIPVFDAFRTALRSAAGNVYPVMVDETTLLWGLQKKTGDTIRYEAGNGRVVYLQLAAALQNSIFQGNLLMDKKLFSEVWSEITGSEITLFKVKDPEIGAVQKQVSQALSEYGVRAMPATQRLKEFNSVTDTYLTIFLTLGGLGLLIGVASFIIVVRKNLASRGEQIALYRSLGFTDRKIADLLTAENRIVPISAVGFGVAMSLAGVNGSVANVSPGVWATAVVFMAALTASVWVFTARTVKRQIGNQPKTK